MIIEFKDFLNEARTSAHYRGYDMFKNLDLSPGSQGYWFIPKLYWRDFGNKIERGFPTVSMTQGREAIDEWFEFSEKTKKYKSD